MQRNGDIIKTHETNIQQSRREEVLTGGLCQALILKKEISCDRYDLPDMKSEPIQCPADCHSCCRLGITLDLSSVEALMVYLLNKEVVELIEEYIALHDASDFCPYMVMDKCIINTYKPTACQMFMPFAHKGKAMCFYLAEKDFSLPAGESLEDAMNSNSYALHGFMMMIQNELDKYFSKLFFKNIYDGTMWWKDNYLSLPDNTRLCLESILNQGDIGRQLTDHFNFESALQAGHESYADLREKHADDVRVHSKITSHSEGTLRINEKI